MHDRKFHFQSVISPNLGKLMSQTFPFRFLTTLLALRRSATLGVTLREMLNSSQSKQTSGQAWFATQLIRPITLCSRQISSLIKSAHKPLICTGCISWTYLCWSGTMLNKKGSSCGELGKRETTLVRKWYFNIHIPGQCYLDLNWLSLHGRWCPSGPEPFFSAVHQCFLPFDSC